jgi:hypothetical protein
MTQPASDATSTVQDASDRLPADSRAKMLQDPVFTRLGWGAGDDADSDDDDEDGVTPDEQVEGRTSETDDHAPLEQPDLDDGQTAAGGGAVRAADLKLTHVDEAVVDEQVLDPTRNELSDAQAPTAQSEDDTDGSLDLWEQPSGDSSSKTEEGIGDQATDAEVDRADDTRQERDADPARHDSGAADDLEVMHDAADRPRGETLDLAVGEETLGERLARWDADRLNLPQPPSAGSGDTGPGEEADRRSADEANAVAYIATNKEQSPWLAPAADCVPAVQSVYASLDQGAGHAHIRHGPALDQQALAGRVARFEDPAQQDEVLRGNGIDGIDPDKLHYCGRYATAIIDPDAFAAVVVGLSEHPDVQQSLRSDWNGRVPNRLEIPIADLLGSEGHKHCIGLQLRGDWDEAKAQRREWALGRSSGAALGDLPEPVAELVPTFEGGDILVIFERNLAASKFEISTFFPDPPES